MTTSLLMTAEDLFHIPDDALNRELVAGELRTMPADFLDRGLAAAELAFALSRFVRPSKLGAIVANVGFVLERNPDTVFAPDVAFIRREHVPVGDARKRYFEGAPDLAVEIISPLYTAMNLNQKIWLYLNAGAVQVWIVDPETRTVAVHSPDRTSQMLIEGETLTGGEVLPGFSMPVSDVFAELEE